MAWRLTSEIENPLGICLNEETGYYTQDHVPYIEYRYDWDGGAINNSMYVIFDIYPGVNDPWGRPVIKHRISFNFIEAARDYIRRKYDLPEDEYIWIEYSLPPRTVRGFGADGWSSEEVVTEWVNENLETYSHRPIASYRAGGTGGIQGYDGIFSARWGRGNQERYGNHRYTGDVDIELNTLDDFLNFYAEQLGTTRDQFDMEYTYWADDGQQSTGQIAFETYWPGTGCTPKITAYIWDDANLEAGCRTILLDLDYSFKYPVVANLTLNKIAAGDGSVTVGDNGNINMRNDGGVFFLNEFGNVGFFANGDASLSANTQVQLGVGATALTVENNCFTFRDTTGNVE